MKWLFTFILLLAFVPALRAQQAPEEIEAYQYYQAGDYKRALPLYEKLYNRFQDDAYYDQYFDVLLRLKDYDQAGKLLQKVLKKDPANPRYQVDYGRLLQERGQQDKGKDWYNKLLRNLPRDENAIRDLAAAFYRADAVDYSIKALLTGREVLKDQSAFTFDLINLYRYQKNKNLLVAEYIRALEKNPEMLAQAEMGLSNVLKESGDFAILQKLLESKLERKAENTALSELLVWSYLQQKEYEKALQYSIDLDKRRNENGERVYELVYTLLSEQAFPVAVDALTYLVDKGKSNVYYIPARVQLLNTKYKLLLDGSYDSHKLQSLEKDYLALLDEFGRASNTAQAMRQLAELEAFYLNKHAESIKLLLDILKIPQLPETLLAETKLQLADVYVLTENNAEASLIYGQVAMQNPNDSLGQEAKFRSARLSYFSADFAWAKAQLDLLKSSTSQFIANDALNLSLVIAENTTSAEDSAALAMYAGAELLIYKNKLNEALSALESINAKHPSNSLSDDILMSRAKILIRQRQFDRAIAELEKIVSNFGYDLWGDDAMFMLGELYQRQLKDPEKAKAMYELLISRYPGSLYIAEARQRFRVLRGDKGG